MEKVLVRAEDIAIKMKQNYDMTSRQYQTWIEKSMVTNETSFTQAIASYLKEHTIADVGTVRGGYRPLRGFPGTLAAGERFLENYSLKDMPKKVVHPWPALQEILFHGRMPVTHPFIPQVPVWGALNGKYSRVIVDQALKNPPAEIRGGSRMLQNDAIYIALKHHKGECFDPKIQLRHGGNVYDSGFDIPNYQTGKSSLPLNQLLMIKLILAFFYGNVY